MKLWLLRPVEELQDNDNPWKPWYNKAFGFIVRAETEERAREIANFEGGDETGEISNIGYRTGGNPWLDPKFSMCMELSPDGNERVIIRDYANA